MVHLPLLVGVTAPGDLAHRCAGSLADAVVSAERCAPAWAVVDENVPVGRAAHRARLLARLARTCPVMVVTDSEARSAGASTLFAAPASERYSNIAPWGHYEDIATLATGLGLAGQVPVHLSPVLPTIQHRDTTDPVLATKRMRILESAEGLRLAGEFAQHPVGIEAEAVCDDPDHDHRALAPPAPAIGCWAGFAAHTERWATHLYAPMMGPFVEVALSGTVAVCGTPLGGRHLSAGRQRLLAVTLTLPCAEGYARTVDDDGTVSLRPDPETGHGSVPLEEIITELECQGIAVTVRSPSSSAHVHRLQRRLPGRKRPFPLP